jgi:sec-independent protein translocase protein TatC
MSSSMDRSKPSRGGRVRRQGKRSLRAKKQGGTFLTREPVDRPVSETLASTIEHPSLLLPHINALRKHLLRMVLALVVGVTIGAVFAQQIINFLAKPIGGIKTLQAIDVTETVGMFMLVALMAGFALALPYIAFELWLFIAPGLRVRARRLGLLGIPLSIIFFLGGVAFAYLLLLPTALPFLLNFMGIHTIPRVSSYVKFVGGLLFWIGIFFESPLVIAVLTLVGLVKPRGLLKQWRYAIVIIAVIAAAITPTVDPVNMALVMLPLVMLYFLSIGLSFLAAAIRKPRKDN